MARVSKHRLDDKLLDRLFELFFNTISNRRSKKEFLSIISDLLSPQEKVMIAKRVAIMYMIMKNIPTIDISHYLHVSRATIYKFKLFTERSQGIVPTFKMLIGNEKMKIFLYKTFDFILGPGIYGTDWKSGWKLKRHMEEIEETF